MMKQTSIIILFLLIYSTCFSGNRKELELRYRSLKTEFINFNLRPGPIEKIKRSSYSSSKPDKMPLFIAGGIAVISGTLILITNGDNYTQSKSSATIGIALGGLGMSGLFVTKYFIDKN